MVDSRQSSRRKMGRKIDLRSAVSESREVNAQQQGHVRHHCLILDPWEQCMQRMSNGPRAVSHAMYIYPYDTRAECTSRCSCGVPLCWP